MCRLRVVACLSCISLGLSNSHIPGVLRVPGLLLDVDTTGIARKAAFHHNVSSAVYTRRMHCWLRFAVNHLIALVFRQSLLLLRVGAAPQKTGKCGTCYNPSTPQYIWRDQTNTIADARSRMKCVAQKEVSETRNQRNGTCAGLYVNASGPGIQDRECYIGGTGAVVQ